MKKIISMLLVLSLVFALSGSVLASDGNPAPAWVGTDGYEHYYIEDHLDAELEWIMARIANGDAEDIILNLILL